MELAALDTRIEAVLGTRLFKLVRFLIAGGLAAATNLAIFFVLVHFAHLHYIHASVVSFIASLAVSFTLQKFWTFRNMPMSGVSRQFARYAIVLSLSLLVNVSLIYFLVEIVGLWNVIAQIITIIMIACFNYVGYQYFVFRDHSAAP